MEACILDRQQRIVYAPVGRVRFDATGRIVTPAQLDVEIADGDAPGVVVDTDGTAGIVARERLDGAVLNEHTASVAQPEPAEIVLARVLRVVDDVRPPDHRVVAHAHAIAIAVAEHAVLDDGSASVVVLPWAARVEAVVGVVVDLAAFHPQQAVRPAVEQHADRVVRRLDATRTRGTAAGVVVA